MNAEISAAPVKLENPVELESIEFHIYRFDPETDKEPRLQNYYLEVVRGAGMMLLAALEKIKEMDPTLSFRRSCAEGVCGSDGMNVNGKNRLTCITHVNDLKRPIVIRPLPGLPVIRDLVVDMTQFYQNYEKVKPYLQTGDAPPPAKEYLQTPEQRAKLDGLYECVLCACCSSSCPSFWWNSDKFLGPAALLQSYRFIVDNRDQATEERLADLQDPYSAFRCRSIMNCTDVCPKHLNPTHAISEIRKEMLKRSV